MQRFAFWSDLPTQQVSPRSSCGEYESSGVVASTQGTCVTCFYHVTGGCHNSVVSNLRFASKKDAAVEEPLPEALFM